MFAFCIIKKVGKNMKQIQKEATSVTAAVAMPAGLGGSRDLRGRSSDDLSGQGYYKPFLV